jgi:hypothetical protein
VEPLQAESDEQKRIDAALEAWRQGDLALEVPWFVHAADPRQPLTSEAAQASGGPTAITSEVEGLVVLSQTCDIVRTCTERPFIEVAPLVQVSESVLGEVRRGRRPAYAFVPSMAERSLVAHLDRVMTVEKSLVASWTRTPGWTTDRELREFAQALARKRARFAFPEDFTGLTRKLQRRLQEKHDKQSAEGQALQALRELRVTAAPSWDASEIELMFWFILENAEARIEDGSWSTYLEAWLKLVPAAGRFKRVDGLVASLEDMTARDYVESDRLDLDHLSSAHEPGEPDA